MVLAEVVADRLLDDIHDQPLHAFLVVGRDDVHGSCGAKEASYMLFEVDDVFPFDVEDVEDPVRSASSAVVDGEQHVLFVSDDLVEMRVVEAVVTELVLAVGSLEEIEDLPLLRDL